MDWFCVNGLVWIGSCLGCFLVFFGWLVLFGFVRFYIFCFVWVGSVCRIRFGLVLCVKVLAWIGSMSMVWFGLVLC